MDNKFGSVVRGAIMRVTLDADGNVVDDSLVTVVPKVVYSGQQDVGFAIYGNWLYYVSPSVKVDKQGNRITTIVDFYRVKLDGTGTQKITEVDSASVNYVFTETALLYHLGSSIYSVDLTGDKFEAKTIAEDVTGYMFPAVKSTGDNAPAVDGYVYYTKADEDNYETANHLYVTDVKGTFTEELIGPDTYTTNANDYVNRVIVTPVKIEDGVLYYNKAYTANGATVAEGLYSGLYSYDLTDWTEGAIDKANEQKLSIVAVNALYTITDGVVLGKTSSNMVLYSYAGSDKITAVDSFASSVEVIAIEDVVETATGLSFKAIFKRSSSEDLYSFTFNYDLADGVYTLNTDAIAQAVRLTETDSVSTYLAAEQIGDWFYYENEWGYISRVKVGEDGAEAEMLGKMTSADWEDYQESLEEDE